MTGADRKHPDRYRNRSEPDGGGPVGDPPSCLDADAKRFWRIFAPELPWLQKSDRAILASASMLRARVLGSAGDVNGALVREYRSTLGCLGATPTNRQRVSMPSETDQDDPFSAFDGPRQ
ncbi:hypothetical protein E4L95_12360 [Paracoccus liaowanqingii]|uniref:Uncharacterized protein n=1 Tax=Paracoccus liaowanqingii TaxID=2560053 RepID=A0A4Z1CBK1_9RHOB|nr:hypothetical protein E4L95_12360 [Paracoccus liaowanqingii]